MGILGQKGRFWTIFGQKGAIFEFSVKKRKRHFFTHFFSFFNTKNQKILMRGFSGKWARTNGRIQTEVNPKVHRLRRETKNQTIPKNRSEEKWEKPHFHAFLRGLRGIRVD